MASNEAMETGEEETKTLIEKHLLLALPQLSKNQTSLAKVLDCILALGVEKPSEFHLINQDDIDKSILKPIQIRKIQQYVEKDTGTSDETISKISDDQASGSAKKVCQTRAPKSNWVEMYKIDPEMFRKSVKCALLSGKNLNKKTRKNAVQDLLNDILKVCPRPLTSQLMEIAKMLYCAYPEAICDKYDGAILGCGYSRFGYQLKTRIENMTRDKDNNIPNVRKSQKSKYVKRADCINSHPQVELCEKESALAAQTDLKALSHELNPDTEVVKKKLHESYVLQRADLNNELHGKQLHENWPFLFEIYGIYLHNQLLLQKDIGSLFAKFFMENGKKILGFFSRIKTKEIREIMKKYDSKFSFDSQNSVACIIQLLLTHFKEDQQCLFPCYEPGTDLNSIQKKIKAHPCLVISGRDIFTADNFMVALDNHIVNDHVKGEHLMDALGALLGTYYMVNVSYPPDCACFLEFFQRCAAKINPQEAQARKKPPPINQKVLALINKLGNYEWSSESDINIIDNLEED